MEGQPAALSLHQDRPASTLGSPIHLRGEELGGVMLPIYLINYFAAGDSLRSATPGKGADPYKYGRYPGGETIQLPEISSTRSTAGEKQ